MESSSCDKQLAEAELASVAPRDEQKADQVSRRHSRGYDRVSQLKGSRETIDGSGSSSEDDSSDSDDDTSCSSSLQDEDLRRSTFIVDGQHVSVEDVEDRSLDSYAFKKSRKRDVKCFS